MTRPPKAEINPLFVTELYRARVLEEGFLEELDDACRALADEDESGQEWSRRKGYLGYTSYASLNDLPERDSLFANLRDLIDPHVAAFCEALEFDLGKSRLKMNSLWVNILEPMGSHSNHIHPHSIISGTIYVHVPDGASSLRLEDPRLDRFMAAPLRRTNARPEHQTFYNVVPEAGTLLLWESWLRHEVPINMGDDLRISVSFNYG